MIKFLKRVLIEARIDTLAEDFNNFSEEEFKTAIQKIINKASLSQMKAAIDIYLENDISFSPDEYKTQRMAVIKAMCLLYGEKICPYLDSIAFGKYDWTQYGAIDLLCSMATEKEIRTKETLMKIIKNFPDFRYETQMNTITFLRKFQKNENIYQIFDTCIDDYKESLTDLLHILQCYYQYDQVASDKYKTLIYEVALNNSNSISIEQLAYIFKTENGVDVPYDESGNVIDQNRDSELLRVQFAVLYSQMDSENLEINSFIKEMKRKYLN